MVARRAADLTTPKIDPRINKGLNPAVQAETGMLIWITRDSRKDAGDEKTPWKNPHHSVTWRSSQRVHGGTDTLAVARRKFTQVRVNRQKTVTT